MAVSLWLLFDQQLYLQSVGAESTDYFVGTYIILGVGMLMTLVGKLIFFSKMLVSYLLETSLNS